jgi:hypothetical protein
MWVCTDPTTASELQAADFRKLKLHIIDLLNGYMLMSNLRDKKCTEEGQSL